MTNGILRGIPAGAVKARSNAVQVICTYKSKTFPALIVIDRVVMQSNLTNLDQGCVTCEIGLSETPLWSLGHSEMKGTAGSCGRQP